MKEYLGNQLQYCGNKALQCTCQLFFKTKAKGSGILLSVKGEDFLVSAAHVLEPEIIESMTIPNGEILVQIQGEMRVTKFQLNETREDDKIDIAIVKLTKACSNDLKKRFIFLDEIQIDFNHLELDSHQYFFCGFPVVDTNVDIQQIKIFPVPMKVRTKITKKKLFEATDYYKGSKWILDYDRLKQLSVVNYEKKIPSHPRGISGSGLWTIPYNPEIEIDKTDMKLVGIMTDFFEKIDDVVAATNIRIVMDIINNEF